jgi:hypothetical protein
VFVITLCHRKGKFLLHKSLSLEIDALRRSAVPSFLTLRRNDRFDRHVHTRTRTWLRFFTHANRVSCFIFRDHNIGIPFPFPNFYIHSPLPKGESSPQSLSSPPQLMVVLGNSICGRFPSPITSLPNPYSFPKQNHSFPRSLHHYPRKKPMPTPIPHSIHAFHLPPIILTLPYLPTGKTFLHPLLHAELPLASSASGSNGAV